MDERIEAFIVLTASLIARGHPPEINPFKSVISDYGDKRIGKAAKNYKSSVRKLWITDNLGAKLWDKFARPIYKAIGGFAEEVGRRDVRIAPGLFLNARVLKCPFCGAHVDEQAMTIHFKKHKKHLIDAVLAEYKGVVREKASKNGGRSILQRRDNYQVH